MLSLFLVTAWLRILVVFGGRFGYQRLFSIRSAVHVSLPLLFQHSYFYASSAPLAIPRIQALTAMHWWFPNNVSAAEVRQPFWPSRKG